MLVQSTCSDVIGLDGKPHSGHASPNGSGLEFPNQEGREPQPFEFGVRRDLPDRACPGLLGEVDTPCGYWIAIRTYSDVLDLTRIDPLQLHGDVLQMRPTPGPGDDLDLFDR